VSHLLCAQTHRAIMLRFCAKFINFNKAYKFYARLRSFLLLIRWFFFPYTRDTEEEKQNKEKQSYPEQWKRKKKKWYKYLRTSLLSILFTFLVTFLTFQSTQFNFPCIGMWSIGSFHPSTSCPSLHIIAALMWKSSVAEKIFNR
jgi:hypothetical protein